MNSECLKREGEALFNDLLKLAHAKKESLSSVTVTRILSAVIARFAFDCSAQRTESLRGASESMEAS